MWARIASAALGIWLMASPAVLNYGGVASTNDRILGPLVASLVTIAIWAIARPLRWTGVPLGLWLLVAPWILGFSDGVATANSMIVGFLIVGLSFVRGTVDEEFGGGWSSLWRAGRDTVHG